MKELELKHLAPYLPYGLKITFEGDDNEHEMVGIGLDGVKLLSPFNDYGSARFEDVKPLLHPLSRLTDEKFWKPLLRIMINRGIYKSNFAEGHDKYKARIIEKPFGKIFKLQNHDDWVLILSFNEIDRCKTFVFNWLVANHFDVFSLIDQGIAEQIKLDQ